MHLLQRFLPRNARIVLSVVLGTAIVSRPSARLSVCSSVTLSYSRHIGWTSSKLITLRVFAPRSHNIGNLVQGEHPKILVE